jgi:demethylmenaquinone methyltransferase/2-methoxy-6-polyprenyl-1,4-benzoquinol methylase
MRDKETRVQRMFSSIAGYYDVLNTLLSFSRDKYWRRYAVSKAGLNSGEKILDLATGTGKLALELADKVGEQGDVIGIDFCPEMLHKAKDNSRKARYQNVVLIQANANALPFQDCTFDCVAAGFVLRNVADIESTLQEVTRVLRPTGKLVCLEFSQPRNTIFRGLFRLYIFGVIPFLGALLSRSWHAYSYLPRSIVEFPSPVELREAMEKIGLRNIEIYPLTFGTVTVLIGTKKYGNNS